MSSAHTIIAAVMTDQSAHAVDVIKSALEKRTEAAIQNFVSSFDYALAPETEDTNAET